MLLCIFTYYLSVPYPINLVTAIEITTMTSGNTKRKTYQHNKVCLELNNYCYKTQHKTLPIQNNIAYNNDPHISIRNTCSFKEVAILM